MGLEEMISALEAILPGFSVHYVDFTEEGFLPYRLRGIGAVVRFDEGKIYLDRNLPPAEEEVTWAHELLSIYYFLSEGVIRHDEEVEAEAKELVKSEELRELLRRLREKFGFFPSLGSDRMAKNAKRRP